MADADKENEINNIKTPQHRLIEAGFSQAKINLARIDEYGKTNNPNKDRHGNIETFCCLFNGTKKQSVLFQCFRHVALPQLNSKPWVQCQDPPAR